MIEKVAIRIRKDLYEKAQQFIEEQGGFNTVEEFVEFLLQEALETETASIEMSSEDEERVRERLRSLGYL